MSAAETSPPDATAASDLATETVTPVDDRAAVTGEAITVVGDATPEQVAALVAVLAAAGGSGEDDAAPPSSFRSSWAARDRAMRTVVAHGAGGWRASGRPA